MWFDKATNYKCTVPILVLWHRLTICLKLISLMYELLGRPCQFHRNFHFNPCLINKEFFLYNICSFQNNKLNYCFYWRILLPERKKEKKKGKMKQQEISSCINHIINSLKKNHMVNVLCMLLLFLFHNGNKENVQVK